MSDTKVNHTECCSLIFIGDNHSPYATQKGIVVCRNCGTEYGQEKIKTLESKLAIAVEEMQRIEKASHQTNGKWFMPDGSIATVRGIVKAALEKINQIGGENEV